MSLNSVMMIVRPVHCARSVMEKPITPKGLYRCLMCASCGSESRRRCGVMKCSATRSRQPSREENASFAIISNDSPASADASAEYTRRSGNVNPRIARISGVNVTGTGSFISLQVPGRFLTATASLPRGTPPQGTGVLSVERPIPAVTRIAAKGTRAAT